MKKILLKVLIGILVFCVVVGVTGAFLIFNEPEDAKNPYGPTVVDANGTTYLAVADGNGTSYVVVTDKDNNRYAAEFDGTNVGATVGQINDQVDIEDLPPNYTGPDVDVTNESIWQGEPSTEAPTTPNPDTAPESSTAADPITSDPAFALKPYRIQKYHDIFASGTYLMEIVTNDPSLGDTPITMALRNGDMSVDTTIEGMTCTMLYRSHNDTMYVIFDEWQKYCKLPKDMLGEDMDMGAMVADFKMAEVEGEITVSLVEIDGQKLILESYVNPGDGTTVNYYFNGEAIVRRDNISKSGAIDSTYFKRFTTDIPNSVFEIPENYGYINLSWLGAIM